jgi:hypothetical protein
MIRKIDKIIQKNDENLRDVWRRSIPDISPVDSIEPFVLHDLISSISPKSTIS